MALTVIIIIAAIVSALGLGLSLLGPDRVWGHLGGQPNKGVDQGPVDFATLERRKRPNDYLVCPKDLCPKASTFKTAPSFEISSTELKEKLKSFALTQSGIALIYDQDLQLGFVHRSPLMGFPDTISIQVTDLGSGMSSLAIYSRSLIGYSDRGANAKRIKAWLKALAD